MIDDIETQWEEWQDSNPASSFVNVDDDKLKESIIRDLAYVSQMDVKEYTLYQKWCEVQEKYTTVVNQTLFGEEVQLLDSKQQIIIDSVKNNIWLPNSYEDYLNLCPVLEYTNDSSITTTKGVDDSDIQIDNKRSKELPEKWNTARTFISTLKNNSNIGRNLNFFVKDAKSNKYLGVVCISSDYLDLTPRDSLIGWTSKLKTQGGMINHTAVGSTIVPFQPLGYNYVGGKLLALLCLSDEVQNLWKKRYGDTLVGVTTTSLYGKTKLNGLSQYDNLDHWQKIGFTVGSVGFIPRRETWYLIREWLKAKHSRMYFEWYVAKKPSGLPHKRDVRNRSLKFAYAKLGIPKEIISTNHARGIYFSPLYNNSYEFLRGEIKEDALVKSFDTSYESLVDIWKIKHAKGRIKQLVKKGNVSYDSLFYDSLIYLSWQETKDRYLSQVGR